MKEASVKEENKHIKIDANGIFQKNLNENSSIRQDKILGTLAQAVLRDC